LVLAGGTGSRLRPITYATAKQLIPVANKPILFYALEDLAEVGVVETGIVISPQTGAAIRGAVGDGSAFGLRVTYIEQAEPAGLAHALRVSLPYIDGDDVLMYLGDNVVRDGVSGIVAEWQRDRPNAQLMLSEVERANRFGVAELDEAGRVIRLVEKPEVPPSNLALVGVYVFDDSVAEAVASIRPSARGELEITDAIQYLIDSGRDVRASFVTGWWKDTGKKEDLLEANELLLADLETSLLGDVGDSTLDGAVVIEAGARVSKSSIAGPVVIGGGAIVTGCTIGPNASIGAGAVLDDVVISDSIVFADAHIDGWRLRRSIIGRGSRLHRIDGDGEIEVTVGDGSDVGRAAGPSG
jgi:glucose-1-phosphate thymidylyltransferase